MAALLLTWDVSCLLKSLSWFTWKGGFTMPDLSMYRLYLDDIALTFLFHSDTPVRAGQLTRKSFLLTYFTQTFWCVIAGKVQV